MDLAAGAAVGSRLARNHLMPGSKLSSAAGVVAALCGIQAQELPAARLAVRPRSTGLTDAGVEAARITERSFVRTWAMRGTLHLVPAKDLAWIRRLLSPGIIRRNARRSAQLGLDEGTYRRAMVLIEDALSEGEALTRAQLREILDRHGVDASGQRAAHLLLRASAEGLICEGPISKGKPAYVLVRKWLAGLADAPSDRESDLVRIVYRYLDAYGPAGPEDLAAWSGLPVSECREAFQLSGGLIEVSINGRPVWTTPERGVEFRETAAVGVRLLPAFDTFLLGYRNRDLHLSPHHVRRVNAGGGIVRPVVLVDGRVKGTWRLVRRPSVLKHKGPGIWGVAGIALCGVRGGSRGHRPFFGDAFVPYSGICVLAGLNSSTNSLGGGVPHGKAYPVGHPLAEGCVVVGDVLDLELVLARLQLKSLVCVPGACRVPSPRA